MQGRIHFCDITVSADCTCQLGEVRFYILDVVLAANRLQAEISLQQCYVANRFLYNRELSRHPSLFGVPISRRSLCYTAALKRAYGSFNSLQN